MDDAAQICMCFTPRSRIGLGVDRLDYTKGLLKRFWAIDAFFEQYPHYRGRFTFVQIAVPTRGEVEAYRRYRELIRATVNEINMRYGIRRPVSAARDAIALAADRVAGRPHRASTRWRPITGWRIWRS